MKSLHVVRTHRPLTGLVAFVRAGAMASPGTRGAANQAAFPSSDRLLGRIEDPLHPGERSALPA